MYLKVNNMSMLEAAKFYIEQGFAVIPQCDSEPKPIITKQETEEQGLIGSVSRPLETIEEVETFWSKWPDANIRIVKDDIAILDIDTHDADKNGFDNLPDNLPKTLVSNSKSDGGHLWFSNPDKRKFKVVNALPGIDLISGHYGLIAPPSKFNGGKAYNWQNERSMAKYPYHLLENKSNDTKVKDVIPDKIEVGNRDDALTKIAGHYFKVGYNYQEAESFLIADNFTKCEQPLDIEQVKKIAQSIYNADENQKEQAIRPLKQRIEEYIEGISGGEVFTIKDLDFELNINDTKDKNNRKQILHRQEKNGVIKRYGQRSGTYRKVDNDKNYLNIFNAKVQNVFLPLPFGLSELVAPMSKHIIVCAGASDAGKTTFIMNVIHSILNHKAQKVESASRTFDNYVVSKHKGKPLSILINEQLNGISEPVDVLFATSEMGEKELKFKCSQFEGGLQSWNHRNLQTIDRSTNFQDIILPNGINCIDFMEYHDKFWLIGDDLRAIHDKLENGIAIINIQKADNKINGKGGSVTREKSRLYLTLDNNECYGQTCKIEKCKIPLNPAYNPKGKTIDYKIKDDRVSFEPLSDWRYIKNQKHREQLNKEYDEVQQAVEFQTPQVVEPVQQLDKKKKESLEDLI